MILLRSLLFAAMFYGGTFLAVIAAFCVAPFGREALTRIVLAWVQYHRWCAEHLLGIRSRIEGAIPQDRVLVAAKHQSMFETFELVRILARPVPILKRELADIPGWGWAARRYGVIAIERSAGASALRSMRRAAQAAVKAGRPVLIFPEGTRVAPGHQPPLQPGFAGIYRSLNLPVVPVALDSGRLWPRGLFGKRPGIVTFRFGAPIAPGLPREEIERQVHRHINALELDSTAPAGE